MSKFCRLVLFAPTSLNYASVCPSMWWMYTYLVGNIVLTLICLFLDLPPLSHEPSDLTLSPGSTAMFRCYSEGHPEVTYSWVHNGVGVRQSSRVILHEKGEVLEIRSIDQLDGGQYRCKAQNEMGEVSSSYAQLSISTGMYDR